MSKIDDLLRANARYAEGFSEGELDSPPARKIAVVTCMDARLETGVALGLTEGDAHVIRNAGGIVTDDVLRSLTISQRMLDTREVMIIQHTRCGMMTFDGAAFSDELENETGARPSFEIGTFKDLEEEVRHSVARVRSCPFLPHTGSVRGFVFEVETGSLREVR